MSIDPRTLKLRKGYYALDGDVYFAKFGETVPLCIQGVTQLPDLRPRQLEAVEAFLNWNEALF